MDDEEIEEARKGANEKVLTKKQQRVLWVLANYPDATNDEIAEIAGCHKTYPAKIRNLATPELLQYFKEGESMEGVVEAGVDVLDYDEDEDRFTIQISGDVVREQLSG